MIKITPLHMSVSPSFLYDVYSQPLDTRSCIISLIHKALDEPLDSVSSQYVVNDILVSLVDRETSRYLCLTSSTTSIW